MYRRRLLKSAGLYDPRFEHDGCGVGFVCNIKGISSNKIIKDGLQVLRRLSHRGATGADPKTGDGAGLLIQMPHEFLKKACRASGIELPERGLYGAGLVFLPQDHDDKILCKEMLAKAAKKAGYAILGWRIVPVDANSIGKTAKATMPAIEQVFIDAKYPREDFERALYIIRKDTENAVRSARLKRNSLFYITNLSSKTLSYKGLLMPDQLDGFFGDLKDPGLKSAICVVHSRYSTNTFPSWDLAQPFRFLAHNGEINTLRGNINWMRSREGMLRSGYFGSDIKKVAPVIVPGGSDSASLDNAFELLILSGRPIEQAMMMLIPSAWEGSRSMPKALKDFYKYHACLMEPWDGPAAVAFTDGIKVGAVLDRNGLRPARYIITKDDTVVMASEVGVLDLAPDDIVLSGRLEPGKMFLVDTKSGRVIDDAEVKDRTAARQPYGSWLEKNMVRIDKLPRQKSTEKVYDISRALKTFGYTREDLNFILKPMAEKGSEPIGSMGNDAPLAVFSKRPQILYNYFKQLFAQVTNPAIDPIREELVMSLESYIGPESNLLSETSDHCHKLHVPRPVLTNEELLKIAKIRKNGFRSKTISVLFKTSDKGAFTNTIERISKEAESAIRNGYTFIILSDRGIDKNKAALPALLATSSVHHHLVKKALRKKIGLIVESAEPREVHHFALLFGYGADCVNPYLAYDCIKFLVSEKELSVQSSKAIDNYRKALDKGILKILSKMGISTIQSYRGAQIFEALGLGDEVIERCFPGTVSRIGGMTLSGIRDECLARHSKAFDEEAQNRSILDSGGVYQWKKDGEFHMWNPRSIAALQDAVRNNDYKAYKEFSGMINGQSQNPCTLRGSLKFSAKGGYASGGKIKPIPVEEVESANDIVKRFATGAMSFGSISGPTHETIAIAMNRLGAKSNTGEGGEDPARFRPMPNGDSARSAIKQVASGRFGVTTNYLANADELQIKIAQGAKPGEGGQLPGHKVSEAIARIRYTTPGVTLISPPPHHDIYSIEDLAQLIFDLKNANPGARISVKLVSEIGVGTVAAGVAKGKADMILISGGDGGTGASPLSSIKHAGLPWELGLSETHQTLLLNNLRNRVRLQTDGQMRTGRDVAIAAALGADEFGFCTAVLVVLGCVMLRHCHLNNCSVGIATQDEALQCRFKGRPEYIVRYFNFIAEELREILAGLGMRKMDDLIGRTDLLEADENMLSGKMKGMDFSRILYKPEAEALNSITPDGNSRDAIKDDGLLDKKLINLSSAALSDARPVFVESPISNTDRSVGAMLSGRICKVYGEEGLPDNTVHCKFKGIAGQSFGAFLANGVTLELEGMANDYVGKGISGGRIIIYPDRKSGFAGKDGVIIGNTAFYGAITGEAYIAGKAGERFCIRNSGLYAVAEGIGDHGCEYMTGGRVVVLGETGENFAAGMSGGIAYIYDPRNILKSRCNTEMVSIENPSDTDITDIEMMLAKHYAYTESAKARRVIDNFQTEIKRFKKVIPYEYKRILEHKAAKEPKEAAEVLDG